MIASPSLLTRVLLSLLLTCACGAAAAMSVTITDPAIADDQSSTTSLAAIRVSGTIGGAGAVRSVLWKSNHGFSDLAKLQVAKGGYTFFTTGLVPLRPGVNHVVFVATDATGHSAETAINIVSTASLAGTAADQSTWKPGTAIVNGRLMSYQERDGLAIYEGDIVLGSAVSVAAADLAAKRAPAGGAIRQGGEVIAYSSGRWPIVSGVGRVPYAISARDQADATALANINQAVSEFNTQLAGVVQFVPATGSDTVYAEYDMDPANLNGVCESTVGYQPTSPQPQVMGGSITCPVPTLLHEMGHMIGLWHEQSRSDRNTYVKFNEANIDKPQLPNFNQLSDNAAASGLYNHASIMHYYPEAFARDGLSVTLESIPAGIPLSTPLPQYTTGDIDAITRLYGGAPKYVVVDTNPSGLGVVIDGVTYTTPQSFEWSMGTSHTLDVPAGAQALSGQNYLFGRWNTPATGSPQTITVTPGAGTTITPAKSPAVTQYLASFIPIHIYSPSVSPAGAGTVSVTPAPSTTLINGVTTAYFEDRQQVQVTATPASGYSFYDWYGAGLFNYYSGAYTFNVTSDLSALGAQFVTGPVTTVNATSPDFGALGSFPGFLAVIDGGIWSLPKNFNTLFDGTGWAAGTSHTLCGSLLVSGACPASSVPAQSPVTTNITYAFSRWSGSKSSTSNALTFTVSGNQSFTENNVPSFRWIVLPSPFTASCDSVTPSGNGEYLDQFFTHGAAVTVDAIPSAASTFVGWSQDLTGTTNPQVLTVTNQLYATANFNLAGATAPLAITSYTPASIVSTPKAETLKINGTGFLNTGATYVYFGNGTVDNYRSSTYVSPTAYDVQLLGTSGATPGDLVAPGYDSIYMLNYDPAGCSAYAQLEFAVRAKPGKPAFKVTKTHTGNFKQGQTGATYTVSVANSGGAATNGTAVTVTDTVPTGLTLVSMSGQGWTCATGGDTCTRSDVLNAGFSYPAITVTVDVAANATSPQVNEASAGGGGAATVTGKNSTVISP